MSTRWNEQGDMIVEGRGVFRPIGWLVNGGPNDGQMFKDITAAIKEVPHGSFSPIYIQVGEE